MVDDAQLLRCYVENRSGEAFAELVRRHLDLVYSVALRQAGGDTHLAEDVVQLVFTALARKAATLVHRPVLGGWLYRSAQYAAIDAVRAERRRRAREEKAHAMSEDPVDEGEAADWGKLRPMLDQAIGELNDEDRDAVVLRFFEGRSFTDVGAKLRLTENSARMRVERALDKLHGFLARRGVSSTTGALAALLANQAVVAAPAALAPVVTSAALAGAGAVAAGGIGIVATFMTMTKLQVGIAGALAVAGATGFALQARTNAELRQELAGAQQQNREIANLQAENLRLAKTAVEVGELRQDDAELARLRDEAVALKARLEKAERVAQANAAGVAANPAVSTYDVSKLDRAPRMKSPVNPVYPVELKQAGIGGEVVVEFIVDATGVVRQPFVTRSSQREFEASAVEAVSQWQFDPGAKGGRQVNTRVQTSIVFTPTETEGTPGLIRIFEPAGKKPEGTD